MLMWAVPVVLLPAALFGTPTNADGASPNVIYACVNPSGLTRIVGANEKCHPSEKLVKWDVSGAQGGTLTVIDSLGKTVGPLIGPNQVILTVGGNRFFVGVGPNRFYSLTGVTFYYADANCSGTPLVPPSTDVFFPYLRLVGTTGYYGDIGSLPQEIQVGSYKNYNNGVPQCITDTSWIGKMMLIQATTVSLSVFTPPFSVE